MKEENFAFIDGQNLNLSVKRMGWKLDYKKFRIYLKDKFCVGKAFMFMGYSSDNEKLYRDLSNYEYIIVFKPTHFSAGVMKGNIDVELALHTMIEYLNFDKAIVISSDGDFYLLIEYLIKNNKFKALIVADKHKYSYLLKAFYQFISFLNDKRDKLEYKNPHI